MLHVVYEYSEQDQNNKIPINLCDSIATDDFFQQSKFQSSRRKSEVSYLNSPKQNQGIDSSTQILNQFKITDEQTLNCKRVGKNIANRNDQLSEKNENKIKNFLNDQSTISDLFQNNPKCQIREDSLNEFNHQNSISSSFYQNQITQNQQNNQKDFIQLAQQLSTHDQNIPQLIINKDMQLNQNQQLSMQEHVEREEEQNDLMQQNKFSYKVGLQKSQFSYNNYRSFSDTQIQEQSDKKIQNQPNQDQSLKEDSIDEEQKVKSLQNISLQFRQNDLNVKYFTDQEKFK
ncbi:hypothetical protein ABPG73_008761 [Tetrahymena malaccensis]